MYEQNAMVLRVLPRQKRYPRRAADRRRDVGQVERCALARQSLYARKVYLSGRNSGVAMEQRSSWNLTQPDFQSSGREVIRIDDNNVELGRGSRRGRRRVRRHWRTLSASHDSRKTENNQQFSHKLSLK
ncbi:MAG: hypothetical protein Q8P35_00520 [Candidatus Yanofskybacteria bacterium]|nr:hypothetical protein [Candidatus Yanofskybacteria bacterium]